MSRDRYEEAIPALSAALDLEREANYRFLPEEYGDGREAFTTTRSTQIMIKLTLAHAYGESEQHERATKAYKEILAIEPRNEVALWGLCFTYRVWRNNFKHPDALYWEKAAEAVSGSSNRARAMIHALCCDLPEIVTLGRSN